MVSPLHPVLSPARAASRRWRSVSLCLVASRGGVLCSLVGVSARLSAAGNHTTRLVPRRGAARAVLPDAVVCVAVCAAVHRVHWRSSLRWMRRAGRPGFGVVSGRCAHGRVGVPPVASRYVVPLAHNGGRPSVALVATTGNSHLPRRCEKVLCGHQRHLWRQLGCPRLPCRVGPLSVGRLTWWSTPSTLGALLTIRQPWRWRRAGYGCGRRRRRSRVKGLWQWGSAGNRSGRPSAVRAPPPFCSRRGRCRASLAR